MTCAEEVGQKIIKCKNPKPNLTDFICETYEAQSWIQNLNQTLAQVPVFSPTFFSLFFTVYVVTSRTLALLTLLHARTVPKGFAKFFFFFFSLKDVCNV